MNATALGAPQTGTSLLLANADAAITRFQLDSFGNTNAISCLRADGTNAAQTAIQNNDQICVLNGWGYDGTANSATSQVSIEMYAAQNWAVGAHGTYLQLATTANGATTRTARLTVANDGGVLIPPAVTGGSQGSGTVNVSGGYYVNGVSIGAGPFLPLAGGTLTGKLTVSGAGLALSGNISQAAWTTNGVRYANVPGTLTDTTSSGTVAAAYTDVFGGSTIAASSAVVFTKYSAVNIAAPVQGTNVTFTNNWALTVDSALSAGLLGTSSAGSAAAPSLFAGNQTTGLYSVSTTGLGFSINGVNKLDYGITAAATLALGGTDIASPVAQTFRAQSVVGGTANTAAVNWAQQASLSTGTGTAGLLNIMTGFASLSENATITATNASPGVITYTAHGLVPGASGQFSNSGGALPTGISAATTYYVCKDANYTVNTFDISLTWTNGACGTLVNTSSTGSGTNTFTTNTTVQNAASTVVAVGPYGLTGSQTTSALAVSQVWNTSGVAAAFTVSITNIAAGASPLLMNLQAGAAGTTTEFSVTAAGIVSSAGGYTTSVLGTGYAQSVTSNGTINGLNVRNSNAGASAIEQIQIGNNTSASEVTMMLNSSANSGGNGANSFTINGAAGIWLQGGGTNALTISSAQLVALPAITTDATHTDTTVCQDTTSHGLYFGSGTAGICLGNVSSIRFKPDYALIADGLGVMNALDPGLYHYGQGMVAGDDGKLKVGFTAERYAAVLPQFTRYDSEGRPNGLDMLAAFPFAVRAIQQLDDKKADRDEVTALRDEVGALRKRVDELEHPWARGATIDSCYLTNPVQCPLTTTQNDVVLH